MKNRAFPFVFVFVFALVFVANPLSLSASKPPEADKHPTHEGHEEHQEKDTQTRVEKEESSSVGPEKGILEANETQGIRLSPEALKNFEIKTQKMVGPGPWSLPESARFRSGEEVNLFRLRSGFFKRVDFTQIGKSSPLNFFASSSEFKPGDEIVTHGVGYLRVAEITAFGGNAEGHSH